MSGLPVVATAVPGVRTIVEDGAGGFVVDVDDVDAMVEATARLVSSPELRHRMGSAARAALRRSLQPRGRGGVLVVVPRAPRGTRRQRPARAKCARYPARPRGLSSSATRPPREARRREVSGPIAVDVHSPGAVAQPAELEAQTRCRERGDDVRRGAAHGAQEHGGLVHVVEHAQGDGDVVGVHLVDGLPPPLLDRHQFRVSAGLDPGELHHGRRGVDARSPGRRARPAERTVGRSRTRRRGRASPPTRPRCRRFRAGGRTTARAR